MPDLCLVTAAGEVEWDADHAPLLAALEQLGVDVVTREWSDPDVDWASAGLTVLRSTWDYHYRRDEFLEWCRQASSRTSMRNSYAVVRTNSHKSYLARLEQTGVPVVPTRWYTRGGSPVTGRQLAETIPWDAVVIQPAVSGGSHLTAVFDLRRAPLDAAAHLALVREASDAMVQPRMSAVFAEEPSAGERSVVWIDGEFTHTVRKSPRLMDDPEVVEAAGEPSDEERHAADAALHRLLPPEEWQRLLYARVDLVRDGLNTLRVMEVELIEPSLFLLQHPAALDRFASSLARHCAVVP